MKRLFEALANTPAQFLNAKTGEEFEDRIQAFMRNSMLYNRIIQEDVQGIEQLRELSLRKTTDQPIANEYGRDTAYIYQPNGRQNYPDFLVFEPNEVVCVETKFTNAPKPVWNSGLPRPNGFYILGRLSTNDITFFKGCEVISIDEAEQMHEFFEHIKQQQHNFNQRMANQQCGFSAYIRKAFDQGRQHNPDADINYYESAQRAQRQRAVIDYFS